MIVVTGGCGFIGRAVCAALMARGHEIIVADTPSASARDTNASYPIVPCDIRHHEEVDQLFHQYPITKIIHLASVLNTASRQQPFEATQVNILGSLHLLEAARQYRVTRFLYGSSISVYGGAETSTITDDNLLSRPPAPSTPYGTAKRHVEMLGMTYQQQLSGQFVALRIAAVIGAGARSATSPWRGEIFERLALGHSSSVEIHIPYSQDAQLPLVFVNDVATMFVRLVEARHLSRPVYNTPAEMWIMQDLGMHLESVAPHIRVTYGQATTGNPTTITGCVFMKEFGYTPEMSIRDRIQQACSLNGQQHRGEETQNHQV